MQSLITVIELDFIFMPGFLKHFSISDVGKLF